MAKPSVNVECRYRLPAEEVLQFDTQQLGVSQPEDGQGEGTVQEDVPQGEGWQSDTVEEGGG